MAAGRTDPGERAVDESSAALPRRVTYVGSPETRPRRLLSSLSEAGYQAEQVGDLAEWNRVAAPHVVVIDGERADSMNALVAEITRAEISCPIVVLTRSDEHFDVLTAVQSGVAGICSLDAPADAVVRTVDDVLAFGASIPRKHIGMLVSQLRQGRGRLVPIPGHEVEVTEREWEVLVRLCAGWTTKAIAVDLYVSDATVRSHVLGLVRKFKVRNRAELLGLCREGPAAT